MANYGNYFPATYNSYYPQVAYPQQPTVQQMSQPPVPVQPAPSSGLIWVQGEAGAKAYTIAPNSSALLMDSEQDVFYIKTTDASGMPSLRVFQYTEVVTSPAVENATEERYVTLEEFNKFKAEMLKPTKTATKKKVTDDAEFAV